APFLGADPASTFFPDGTIMIVVPRSAIGNPAVRQNLPGFLTRITVTAPPNPQTSGVTPDNMPDSLTPSGSYTIIGNQACARLNYALALNGGGAIASSSHSSGLYPPTAAINGDRSGADWGSASGGWNDGTRGLYPDDVEVDFS